MAAIIRIKRSTGSAAPGSLKTGELAYSQGTGTSANGGDRLYFGKGDDGSGNATSVVVIGGEYFGNLADHTPGTLTASSAIITDASNKIDVLNVDNITIDGNTISSTDTNGNIVLDPNGTGVVDVNTSRITNVTDPTADQDAATKAYVDAQNTAQVLTVNGDTGTDTVDLDDSDLTFNGDAYITAAVTNNTVTITHDTSGVSAGTYGSQTEIPVFTVDDRGHIDSAGTVSVATTLSTAADAGTGTVDLLTQTLSVDGGTNIHTVANGQSVIVHMDSDVLGLSSLTVDNIKIDGNTISSTDGSNVLYIDPAPVDSDGGDLIIRGNLTVQGTQTIINSTTMSVNDLNIVLADSAGDGTAADGAGITVGGAQYSGTKPTILWDNATEAWDFNFSVNIEDSIGGANTITFGDTKITEAIEDHLVNNLLLAGEAIDLTYDDVANTLTVSAELATISNPGVASFDSDQFTVTSGAVTIYELDGGTY